MSKRPVWLSLAILMLTAAMSAQQPAAAQTGGTAPFTEQQKAQAREEMKKVGELFGIKPQQQPQTQAQAQQSTPEKSKDLSMADVADKALNMIGNAVGTIAGIVKQVAPEVLEIMVKQQYAAAIGMLLGPMMFMAIIVAYLVIVKRYWKKWPEYEDDDYFGVDFLTKKGARAFLTTLLPTVAGFITAIVLACKIGTAVAMLINPKYYAIRDLLQMLLQ